MKTTIRSAAVAGRFYPENRTELAQSVSGYLSRSLTHDNAPPLAIIAPHAGYPYSGPIAGSAYRGLAGPSKPYNRVIVIGPSHTLAFRGVAAPSASAFESPLGLVPVDQSSLQALQQKNLVSFLDKAHVREHGIEVHLPFLQLTVGSFELIPLITGSVDPQVVADILDHQLHIPNTLVVISSDLSHYHDYTTAQRLDRFAANAIEARTPDLLEPEHACGRTAIQGLLLVAEDRGWHTETMDLRNSGDTAGTREDVVGYGAFLCHV